MTYECDIAVIGAGFSGSLLSMALRRMGRSVVLVDRTHHPRFAIGESTTPLTNLLLESFANTFELPAIAPLAKWGSWQKHHPELACGIKRGFTFYHHERGSRFHDDAQRHSQLLVAASPSEALSETHWYRPDLDQFLFEQARGMGVECLTNTKVRLMTRMVSEDCSSLRLQSNGAEHELKARWVVDASGTRGCLFRLLGLQERTLPNLPCTQSLFAHFRDVRPTQDLEEFQSKESPPYPPDAAATHHLFEGGWIWVLPFNNGVTSAGVALTNEAAECLNLAEGAKAWARLLEGFPSVRRQFEPSHAVTPWIHQPAMPFAAASICGDGWALMPSAAGFIDPLFSTGFPLTLLGLHRLATLCRDHWGQPSFGQEVEGYARDTQNDLDHASRFIAACYRQLGNSRKFASLAKLYFAAVIFAETARRLGRPNVAGRGFLMWDHPTFSPAMMQCLDPSVSLSAEGLQDLVHRAIEPIDLAALDDPRWKNWISVDFDALRQARHKIQGSAEEIEGLISRACSGIVP